MEKAKKKPLFLLFANVHRPLLKAQHPTFSFADMQKALSELWKTLSDEEKQKYQESGSNVNQEKKEETENKVITQAVNKEIDFMPTFFAQNGHVMEPIPARSSFDFYYSHMRRSRSPSLSVVQFRSLLQQQFNDLEETTKNKYLIMEEEDKVRFSKEFAIYTDSKNRMVEDPDDEYEPSEDEGSSSEADSGEEDI